jgi:hypothetical protein
VHARTTEQKRQDRTKRTRTTHTPQKKTKNTNIFFRDYMITAHSTQQEKGDGDESMAISTLSNRMGDG